MYSIFFLLWFFQQENENQSLNLLAAIPLTVSPLMRATVIRREERRRLRKCFGRSVIFCSHKKMKAMRQKNGRSLSTRIGFHAFCFFFQILYLSFFCSVFILGSHVFEQIKGHKKSKCYECMPYDAGFFFPNSNLNFQHFFWRVFLEFVLFLFKCICMYL
jgi:hypothetical protein